MTTEFVLLAALFAFVFLGGFVGDKGPKAVFKKATPMLAARIESQITTGRKFNFNNSGTVNWVPPKSDKLPGRIQ